MFSELFSIWASVQDTLCLSVSDLYLLMLSLQLYDFPEEYSEYRSATGRGRGTNSRGQPRRVENGDHQPKPQVTAAALLSTFYSCGFLAWECFILLPNVRSQHIDIIFPPSSCRYYEQGHHANTGKAYQPAQHPHENGGRGAGHAQHRPRPTAIAQPARPDGAHRAAAGPPRAAPGRPRPAAAAVQLHTAPQPRPQPQPQPQRHVPPAAARVPPPAAAAASCAVPVRPVQAQPQPAPQPRAQPLANGPVPDAGYDLYRVLHSLQIGILGGLSASVCFLQSQGAHNPRSR